MNKDKKDSIVDEMITIDIKQNNNLKNKFKKIIFPTIIILLVLIISIGFVFIINI